MTDIFKLAQDLENKYGSDFGYNYDKYPINTTKPKKERKLGNIMKSRSDITKKGNKYAVETDMTIKKGLDDKTKRALKKSIEQETKKALKGAGLRRMVLSDEESSSDEESINGKGLKEVFSRFTGIMPMSYKETLDQIIHTNKLIEEKEDELKLLTGQKSYTRQDARDESKLRDEIKQLDSHINKLFSHRDSFKKGQQIHPSGTGIKRGRGRPKKGEGDLIHIDIGSHNVKDEIDGEGIKKKKRRGRPKKTTVKKVEVIYKMPVQPFSRSHNESLNQLLDARDYYERQNVSRNVADMAKYIKDDMEGVKKELGTLKQERDFYKEALGAGIKPKKGSQEAKGKKAINKMSGGSGRGRPKKVKDGYDDEVSKYYENASMEREDKDVPKSKGEKRTIRKAFEIPSPIGKGFKKGSQEAKDWGIKMKEAREAKKII